jgi:hypothetical protein
MVDPWAQFKDAPGEAAAPPPVAAAPSPVAASPTAPAPAAPAPPAADPWAQFKDAGEPSPSGAPGGADPKPRAQPQGPMSIKMVGGKIVDGATGAALPEAQAATITQLARGGQLDTSGKAKAGAANFPWVQRAPTDTFGPGEYYIEATTGKLARTPGGEGDQHSFTSGLQAGAGDVAQSLLSLIPGHENSDLYNANQASQMRYNADHSGDGWAKAGRFTGQLATSAPLLAGGEALAGKALSYAPRALAPVAEFLSGASTGGNALRIGSQVARGAQEGAAAAGLTSGASDQPVGEQLIAGAVTGGALRGVASVLSSVMAKSRTEISPAVKDLARTAIDRYGIPLRATQIKGVADRSIAHEDSEMIGRHFTGYAKNSAEQSTAFTRAVAKTFGEDADKLTPEVMQGAKDRIGGAMNDVAKRTTIHDIAPLQAQLDQIVKDAAQVLPEGEVTPLQKQVENIRSAIRDGALSGETYQALTRKNSPLDIASNSANPNIRHYAQAVHEALDDALEKSASPEDVAALTQARWQYKNLMTVKNLAAKANVEGEINPRLLAGAVGTSFKNRAFAGAGDLGELAQIAQTFLKEPANSGTPAGAKSIIKNALTGLATASGGALAVHDPVLAAKVAAVTGVGGAVRAASNALVGASNRSASTIGTLIRDHPRGGSALTGRLLDYTRPAQIPGAVLLQRNALQPSR